MHPAIDLGKRLHRMFPRWRVDVKSYDYGHATQVAFTHSGFPMRRFGINYKTALAPDARAVGGMFLRQAYPRGWATP